jgi:GNAT superfamily N-acetyltransferase
MMDITELQTPIEPILAEELIAFWESIFGISFEWLRGVLAGEERQSNRDLFFLGREGGRLVGTCHLTIGGVVRQVGGIGEVATDPEFRHRGIANELCTRARDKFREEGGRALFLGTTAPNAARVYQRLGWRTLPGTHVMLLTFGSDSHRAFFGDYFRGTSAASAGPATAADRTAIIPLMVAPHDWCVLDANVGMYSTRYATQDSCMGLYPRFEAVRDHDQGDWFAARTEDGRVIGLATVRAGGADRLSVDAFAHSLYMNCMADLIDESVQWGRRQGAAALEAIVSEEDGTKLAQFELAGFRAVRTMDSLPLPGRQLPGICLELPLARSAIVERDAQQKIRAPHRSGLNRVH